MPSHRRRVAADAAATNSSSSALYIDLNNIFLKKKPGWILL